MNNNKITQLLNQNSMSESDVSYLLTLIRKQLEILNNNDIKNYFDLKFFCDWALHKKIDRSYTGSKLGAEIQKILLINNESNTDQLIEEISKKLLEPFKNQFYDFLKSNAYNTQIIDNNQRWKVFLKRILECLESTPISISNASHKLEVSNNPFKVGMWIYRISITKSNLGYLKEQIYCLLIETSDTTMIEIPIAYED